MSKLKVLIVVDVQNCFIAGGSLGAPQEEKTFMNALKQVKEIESLIDQNDMIVFTRDYHPQYHSSFSEVNKGFVFPNHCRNTSRKCGKLRSAKLTQGKQIDITDYKPEYKTISQVLATDNRNNYFTGINSDKLKNIQKYKDLPVKGTELSYLLLGTMYHEPIHKLIVDTPYAHTIGLKDIQTRSDNLETHEGGPDIKLLHTQVTPVENAGKKFIALTKGEFCNFDSYSAFNYHQNQSKGWPGKYMKCSEKNSTGLCEYLQRNIPEGTQVQFTVCGLVGNICVMNTVHNGLVMTKLPQYPKLHDSKFIYSCKGTLWLPGHINGVEGVGDKLPSATPSMNKNPESDYMTKEKKWFIEDLRQIRKDNNNVLVESGKKSIEYKISLDDDNEVIGLPIVGIKLGGSYEVKYLKYKQKYLELKNLLNHNRY